VNAVIKDFDTDGNGQFGMEASILQCSHYCVLSQCCWLFYSAALTVLPLLPVLTVLSLLRALDAA
jgi:hypothetical protein